LFLFTAGHPAWWYPPEPDPVRNHGDCDGRLAAGIPDASLPGLLTGSPVVGNPERPAAMPIDPAKLASSIGALDTLSLESGLARTLQQVLDSAKALFERTEPG
jgi:hypothetical protein